MDHLEAMTALVLGSLAPDLAAQEHELEVERPAYRFLRQNEDWSAYGRTHDLASTGDVLDPIKYVPLTSDGRIWISLGGHLRARFENWNHFGFDLTPDVGHDDAFVLSRLLLHADLHLGPRDRIFVEGKTAQSTHRDLPGGTRPLDVDSLALQQAFWDHTASIGEGELTLRLGRQMLLLARQRLVSPLPWGNTLRSWDGASAFWKAGAWKTQAFWTLFDPVDIGDFNKPATDRAFYGVHATHAPGDARLFDLYFYGYDRGTATFNGTSGAEERYTLGFRAHDQLGNALEYDLECAYQLGRVGTGDVNAYMLALELEYRLTASELRPRLWVGLDIASGDEGTGSDVQTFNQLYPLAHAYLGYLDTIARQNILGLTCGGELTLTEGWTGRLDLHHFRLMNDSDALYDAGGAVVVPGGTSTSNDVGFEIDLTTSYRIDRHTVVSGGAGHLFAGSLIEDAALATGSGGEDIVFAYAAIQFTF